MSHNIVKHFLNEEKKRSDFFLETNQIPIDRFDESDYHFLLPIFNCGLANKIYSIIDDIVEQERAPFSLRSLILADFLFSICSYEPNDPANIIFKITRNEYIQNILLRALINQIFDCEYHTYVKMHKKLLIGLRLSNLINKREIRTVKDGVGSTTIYIELSTELNSLTHEFPIGFSKFPFIVIDAFNSRYSIGSFRNIGKVKRKKREMESIGICDHGVIKANNIEFFLSRKTYNLVKETIENEEKKLLKETDCSSLENYYEKLKNITKDKIYSEKFFTENIDSPYFRIYKKTDIYVFKNFQKIYRIGLLRRDIFEKKIYLPNFIDNRGRQYYGTLISPTFHKLFRYLYEFQNKKEFINLQESTFYKKIIQYKHTIKEFEVCDQKSYLLIILFIEIGKSFIKNKENYIINTEKIIKKGIEVFKERNIYMDFEDEIYFKKICNLIENIGKNKNTEYNTIIFKDATASGLQNYGIILGYKEEMLKYINLDGDDGCDTYQYIINNFLEEISPELKKRKYGKKTIMTIPYNASGYTCFTELISALRKDGIEYNRMDIEEKNKLKIIHKKFYEKIKSEIKNTFYKNEKKNLKNFKYNKGTVVNKKEYKINYKKGRDKYTDVLYMINEDEESTKRALEANNMHYLDAKLVSELLKKFEIIPIHDCFGIRLNEIHLVMDEINKYYSEKIKKNTYSIHIII